MAANIEQNKERGTASFVSRKEIPWHGLGTVVENAMTSQEAIKLANLDYEVGLAEIYAKYPKELWKNDDAGNQIRGAKVPGSFATFRKDNLEVFSLVGARYEVIQNTDAFKFIDDIIQTGEAVIETAGALGRGEKIFITAKLPSYIKLGNGNDVIEDYLFITNTHDSSGMVTAALTKIRIVCNNTLDMALRNCTNKIQFKHTKNVKDRLEQSAKLMNLTNKFNKEFEEALSFLQGKPVDDNIIVDVLYKIFLTPDEIKLVNAVDGKLSKVATISTKRKNIIADAAYSIDGGPGQELYRGTGLWLFNGITSYLSNTRNYSDNEDRLVSLMEGTESKIRQKAFDLITTI